MQVDWQKTREKYAGRVAVGGVDLSAVDDLTCYGLLFPWDGGQRGVDFVLRTWCPQAKLETKKNKYRDQYLAWADAGWVEVSQRPVIEHDYVRKEILADSEIINMDSIAVDRGFNGIEFCSRLNDDLGGSDNAPVVFGYWGSALAPACNELERLLLNLKLNHGGNPVLRWMADCATVRINADGHKRPDKDKSQGKIDGLIVLLLCLARLETLDYDDGANDGSLLLL